MTATTSALARKRQVACDAILNATSEVIAEKGVDAFTISEVGRRAKINRALVYHYFQDRNNLVAQTINHILSRYLPAKAPASIEAVESGIRMHIEHPEIARFFFQMLLTGRSLQGVGPWLRESIEGLEEIQRKADNPAGFDETFVGVMAVLAQLSWAFSRHEMARLLGMKVEEADKRFLAQIRRTAKLRMQAPPARRA